MNPRGDLPSRWSLALILLTALAGPAARADWEAVGTPGFSAGSISYTSLAFYNGEPYVAYQDGGNGNKATVICYVLPPTRALHDKS